MPNRALLKTLRVLMVDDEVELLEVGQRFFQRIFKEVYIAGSGREALEMMERETPNLVVTDLSMPGMDGKTLAVKIRERYPQIPIFFMTALDSDPEGNNLAQGYIRKPLNREEMVSRVVETLCAQMEEVVGNCDRCLFFGEEGEQVRCDLDGNRMEKHLLLDRTPISTPCPFPFGECRNDVVTFEDPAGR